LFEDIAAMGIIMDGALMALSPIPGLIPIYEDYARCIHCGLCLNACPTYRLWNLEADSPRGRIHQMIHVEQGNVPVTDSFVDHIDKCLDCRACETACPSGVEYGKLVEYARARIERDYRRPLLSRVARDVVYRRLLPYPKRIAIVARLLRFYQRSGLQSLARSTGVLKSLGVDKRERLLPRVDSHFFYDRLGKTFPAVGERRARVAFFAGCVANVTFAELNAATVRVLTANGCDVVVPDGQLCCGALAAHAGVRDVARQLARENLRAFLLDDVDATVTNAAGCGSTLKEYDRLFTPGEPEYGQAAACAKKTRDVTEFLANLGLSAPLKALPLRVTYQDSCHLLHGQKVRDAPRKLLRSIPGLNVVELPHSELCCGSAGVYNVTHTEASLELLAEKMQCASATGARVIATSNPGCLLQMRAGAEMHRTNQQVLHVIELLDQAITN
jgi:glycolate oxidase iron-sulfur subunit